MLYMLVKREEESNQPKRALRGWQPGKQHISPEWLKKQHPVTRRASKQVTERQRFALVASMWQLVSAAQRVAWSDAVAAYIAKAATGQKMPENGFTLFMYVNLIKMAAGAAIVLDAPTPIDIPTFTITEFTVQAADQFSIKFNSSDVLTNWLLSIQVQPVSNAGSMQPTGRWQRIYNDNVVSGQVITLSGSSAFPFTNIQLGQKLFIMAMLSNSVTGQQSQPVVKSAIFKETFDWELRSPTVQIAYSPQVSNYRIFGGAVAQPAANVSTARMFYDVQVTSSPSTPPDRGSAEHFVLWQWVIEQSTINLVFTLTQSWGIQPSLAPGNKLYIWMYLANTSTHEIVSESHLFELTIPPMS